MRKLGFILVLALVGLAPRLASADTLTFTPPDPDMNDLDHHYIYTWKINGLNTVIPSGQVVTGAQLFFDNIRNWDSTENRLYTHLLDTSRTWGSDLSTVATSSNTYGYLGGSAAGTSASGLSQGLYRAQDASGTPVPASSIIDDFAVTSAAFESYTTAGQKLVTNGTNNTVLGNYTQTLGNGRNEGWVVGAGGDSWHSFTESSQDYTYNFNSAQILDLRAYIANGGDIAIALDPDCHFDNSKVQLILQTGPAAPAVPEPASLTLLGLGPAGLYVRRRKKIA